MCRHSNNKFNKSLQGIWIFRIYQIHIYLFPCIFLSKISTIHRYFLKKRAKVKIKKTPPKIIKISLTKDNKYLTQFCLSYSVYQLNSIFISSPTMKLSFLLFNAFAYFNFMWGSPGLLDAFLANAFVQVVIFISIGCLPAMIFKRIWVSDIAYSAGISCIGLQILFAFPTSGIMRNTLIGGAYLLIGIKHLVMCLYRVFSG